MIFLSFSVNNYWEIVVSFASISHHPPGRAYKIYMEEDSVASKHIPTVASLSSLY